VKTLAELQAVCAQLGIGAELEGHRSKETWIAALRKYHWEQEHPNEPLPAQTQPMLLSDWSDLSPEEAESIENDLYAWVVQPKLDGVRALLHVEDNQVRITGRNFSETTYRLSEFQENLPHLETGLRGLAGTVLDGELVCPLDAIDTGNSVTATALQAAVAILATSPENAGRIQDRYGAHLHFHAFDILKLEGVEVTALPLVERQGFLHQAIRKVKSPYLELVPSYAVGKLAVHLRILESGREGTVWKRADGPYEPGRRVKHWIKRKRGIEVEAFVSGFKPGNNGHADMVGAVEFSVRRADGTSVPVAWVSNWTDTEREAMTVQGETGHVRLHPAFLGRRAMIVGHDESVKSHRLRHARFRCWLT
jgi:ATP-dependent DNA ligase